MNEEYYGNNYNNNQRNQYPQGNGEPENQNYGYPNQQGYVQQDYGYNQQQNYGGTGSGGDDGSKKKILIIVLTVLIVALLAVGAFLAVHLLGKDNGPQKAYSDLLTEIKDDPEEFFSEIDEIKDYDFSDIEIDEDEFSVTDTDGDSVPELIVNVKSAGKKNSFSLVYDYDESDGADLRCVAAADPEFYSDGTIVTKDDSTGKEVTLIEKYNSGSDKYTPAVKYYQSEDPDTYFAEVYENNSQSSAETYTYDELTCYIAERILQNVQKLIIDYHKITESNIKEILSEDSFTPEYESALETTTAVSTTEEVSADPDFSLFINVMPSGEYDSALSDSGLLAHEYLTEGYFGTAKNYLSSGDYEEISTSSVPGGMDRDYESYIRYSADAVDNLIREAYNTEPPARQSEYKYHLTGLTYGYYRDGYYYIGIPSGHGCYSYKIEEKTLGSDGIYTITAGQYDVGDIEGVNYTVKAKPVVINGKSNWCFCSVTKDEAEETTEAENEWAASYRAKLTELYSEYGTQTTEGICFELIYINDDDIPELAVSLGGFHVTGVEIYTFSNGSVFDMGSYGSYGEISYCERKGLVESYYGGSGTQIVCYYRMDGTKLTEIDSFTETDGSMDEAGVPAYYVNENVVSESEYNSMLDKYNAYNWKTIGRNILLTPSNISAYCR